MQTILRMDVRFVISRQPDVPATGTLPNMTARQDEHVRVTALRVTAIRSAGLPAGS
jgi:hypothetical protein